QSAGLKAGRNPVVFQGNKPQFQTALETQAAPRIRISLSALWSKPALTAPNNCEPVVFCITNMGNYAKPIYDRVSKLV
ncbi:MAG: hypothetical protein OEZ19_07385, partial [Paracoccaceae bacterium]|nr:hypothetical protein [Paracoccaceae bacterium]